MANVTCRILRTEPDVNTKRGEITIVVTATQAVLASQTTDFPIETGDGYIVGVLVDQLRSMMQDLAAKQIPMDLQFTLDSDQVRLRRLFDI